MRPNFLIIGAAKSGTTSLAVNLSTHPEVFLARSETHFFSYDSNWEEGTATYEVNFDAAPSDAVAVGEKSPSYLYSPDAPGRIAETFGENPLFCCIAILREPVARAVSQVAHRRRLNAEHKTVTEALIANLDHLDGTFDYIGRGHYAEQLSRFIDVLGADRVHVELYEDLVGDPDALLDRLCARLELSSFSFPLASRRINESATIRYPRLYRELIRIRAGKWLPPELSRWVWGKLQEPVAYEMLPPALAGRIQAHYAPHNRDLEVLLGRTLPANWRQPDSLQR